MNFFKLTAEQIAEYREMAEKSWEEQLSRAYSEGRKDEAEWQALKADATIAELLEALKFARAELAGLPHSLGHDFTHLPKIDTAIQSAEGAKP